MTETAEQLSKIQTEMANIAAMLSVNPNMPPANMAALVNRIIELKKQEEDLGGGKQKTQEEYAIYKAIKTSTTEQAAAQEGFNKIYDNFLKDLDRGYSSFEKFVDDNLSLEKSGAQGVQYRSRIKETSNNHKTGFKSAAYELKKALTTISDISIYDTATIANIANNDKHSQDLAKENEDKLSGFAAKRLEVGLTHIFLNLEGSKETLSKIINENSVDGKIVWTPKAVDEFENFIKSYGDQGERVIQEFNSIVNVKDFIKFSETIKDLPQEEKSQRIDNFISYELNKNAEYYSKQISQGATGIDIDKNFLDSIHMSGAKLVTNIPEDYIKKDPSYVHLVISRELGEGDNKETRLFDIRIPKDKLVVARDENNGTQLRPLQNSDIQITHYNPSQITNENIQAEYQKNLKNDHPNVSIPVTVHTQHKNEHSAATTLNHKQIQNTKAKPLTPEQLDRISARVHERAGMQRTEAGDKAVGNFVVANNDTQNKELTAAERSYTNIKPRADLPKIEVDRGLGQAQMSMTA